MCCALFLANLVTEPPPVALQPLVGMPEAKRGLRSDKGGSDAVPHPLVATPDAKRRLSTCEGGKAAEKKRRITDFFVKNAGEGKSSAGMYSAKLATLAESAIQKLETGNAPFRQLRLDDNGSFLSYYPSLIETEPVFPEEKLNSLMEQLLLEPGGPNTVIPWSQGRLKVYGKEHMERRFTCFFADATDKVYSYSGRKDLKVNSWTDRQVCPPILKDLRNYISALCGCQFDTALLNFYRDGEDCIGWHADDEAIYGGKSDAKSIVGVSFGAEREFQIRPKPSKRNPPQPISKSRDKLSITLRSGSVIVMGGAMQQHWQHSVPQRKRVSSPRVSVTFRKVSSFADTTLP